MEIHKTTIKFLFQDSLLNTFVANLPHPLEQYCISNCKGSC